MIVAVTYESCLHITNKDKEYLFLHVQAKCFKLACLLDNGLLVLIGCVPLALDHLRHALTAKLGEKECMRYNQTHP